MFFIDIGIDGEVVFGSVDCIMVCLVVVGLVFEGVDICCGFGGVFGVVDFVVWVVDELGIGVIGDVVVSSICGFGFIDFVVLLLDDGVIDEMGWFDEEIVWEMLVCREWVCEVEGEFVLLIFDVGLLLEIVLI